LILTISEEAIINAKFVKLKLSINFRIQRRYFRLVNWYLLGLEIVINLVLLGFFLIYGKCIEILIIKLHCFLQLRDFNYELSLVHLHDNTLCVCNSYDKTVQWVCYVGLSIHVDNCSVPRVKSSQF
jgi:hypothetical protein